MEPRTYLYFVIAGFLAAAIIWELYNRNRQLKKALQNNQYRLDMEIHEIQEKLWPERFQDNTDEILSRYWPDNKMSDGSTPQSGSL